MKESNFLPPEVASLSAVVAFCNVSEPPLLVSVRPLLLPPALRREITLPELFLSHVSTTLNLLSSSAQDTHTSSGRMSKSTQTPSLFASVTVPTVSHCTTKSRSKVLKVVCCEASKNVPVTMLLSVT